MKEKRNFSVSEVTMEKKVENCASSSRRRQRRSFISKQNISFLECLLCYVHCTLYIYIHIYTLTWVVRSGSNRSSRCRRFYCRCCFSLTIRSVGSRALSLSRACNWNETNRCEQHPPISFSILLVSSDWFCVYSQWQSCWVGIRFVYSRSINAISYAVHDCMGAGKKSQHAICMRRWFPCLRAPKRDDVRVWVI